LEQEWKNEGSQRYDALVLDAFSGDSVPMHLLTEEAFALYFQHLKEDGVLLVHVTNLYLDLRGPVLTAAQEFGKDAVEIERDTDAWAENYSHWILITSNEAFLDDVRFDGWALDWAFEESEEVRWTDDYSNLLQVLR
ncbi:MAG: hypothetical protein AAGJ31_11555, partial [Verrucomicrobiota bacterium]